MATLKTAFLLVILVTLSFGKAPAWVQNRPTPSSDYIGIGVATKEEFNSKDEWRKAAEMRALNNISSAISVSIQGASSLSMTATTENQQELYREDIQSLTKANLEGYEFVDSWENRKEYWVYYKLSKAKWQQIEQKRLREGTAKAKSYIDNGQRLANQGNTLSAARSYIKAFSEIVPILHLNPEISHNGNNVPLIAHVDEHMVSLLNTMEFKATKPLYRGTRDSYGVPAEPTVTLTTSNGAVSSYPLIVDKSKLFTDKNGTVSVSKTIIDSLTGDEEVLLSITTDIDQIIPAEEKSRLTRQWLSQMKWPALSAQLFFEKPAVYIESVEDGYADLPYEQLETGVKERLGDIGMGIARFPEDAEYRLVIKSSTRPAGSMGNLYFTYLDITWSLFNKSGDELMTDALKPVKGGALSYDDAGIKAFGKGSVLLADTVTSWIKENR